MFTQITAYIIMYGLCFPKICLLQRYKFFFRNKFLLIIFFLLFSVDNIQEYTKSSKIPSFGDNS